MSTYIIISSCNHARGSDYIRVDDEDSLLTLHKCHENTINTSMHIRKMVHIQKRQQDTIYIGEADNCCVCHVYM